MYSQVVNQVKPPWSLHSIPGLYPPTTRLSYEVDYLDRLKKIVKTKKKVKKKKTAGVALQKMSQSLKKGKQKRVKFS